MPPASAAAKRLGISARPSAAMKAVPTRSTILLPKNGRARRQANCLVNFEERFAGWSKRYPRIVEAAARIKGSAVMDAEVVCLDDKGVPNFDTLHSRTADHLAIACAFDLLMVNGDDLRRQSLRERKEALGKLLLRSVDGIQYAPTCRRSWRPDV